MHFAFSPAYSSRLFFSTCGTLLKIDPKWTIRIKLMASPRLQKLLRINKYPFHVMDLAHVNCTSPNKALACSAPCSPSLVVERL